MYLVLRKVAFFVHWLSPSIHPTGIVHIRLDVFGDLSCWLWLGSRAAPARHDQMTHGVYQVIVLLDHFALLVVFWILKTMFSQLLKEQKAKGVQNR